MLTRKFCALLPVVTIIGLACADTKPEFQLEKVIFHSSSCYGPCPIYDLEINADRSCRLHRESYDELWDVDTTQSGNFTGNISDSLFNTLKSQLQNLGLDTIDFGNELCCDGSVVTIIVYYDGKRKKFESMWPPEAANKVIGTFYHICAENNFIRTSGEFQIEK